MTNQHTSTNSREARGSRRRGDGSLIRRVTLAVGVTAVAGLCAAPGCVTTPADEPVALTEVDVDSELATHVFVEASELGDPSLDPDGDGRVFASELAPGAVAIDVDELEVALAEVAGPGEPAELEAASRGIAVPNCYFVRNWKVWYPVRGQICIGGSCWPITYKVLVDVECHNQSFCFWQTPNVIECVLTDPWGFLHTTSMPAGEPYAETWEPCGGGSVCPPH